MRPPAIEKMGYYPTDEPVIEIIKTYIRPPEERGRLFDPCAGEGKAAAGLGSVLNCETWGVELSYTRAAKAAQVMDKVHQAPWQACSLSEESVSLVFLNPPYEFEHTEENNGKARRQELEFLKSTTLKLMRGGLLVYIIPQHILGIIEVARILVGQYDCMTVGRFPDGLFEKFKQVVVFALRRKNYKVPSDKEIEEIRGLASSDLPVLEGIDEPVYDLLPASSRGSNGKPVVFKRLDWSAEEMVEATRINGIQRSKEWLDLIHPNRGMVELDRPVMPLKKGHIAMMMASGMMGTVRLTDQDGRPMLIKGRVIKVVEKTTHPDSEDKDVVVETYRDRFVTTVAVVQQEEIKVIQDVQGLTEFMKTYGDKIAAHVLETYRPLYSLDPTEREIQVLDRLGQNRKPLPGQEKPGLLPAQRHAAAAMARSIRKHGVGNLQGEMGLGVRLESYSYERLPQTVTAVCL